MELLQLKYFTAVAECGKIKTAAEQLFVSSPALSAAISRLESDLGVCLFDRSNNRITLNRQGEIFLSYVNQIFTSLDNAKKDIQLSLEERSVNIPLAVTSSNLWMELFDAYSLTNPDVTLSVSTYHLTRLQTIDLYSEYVFLLAARDDMQRADLDSQLLFMDRPYVMLPKDHPLAQGDSVDLKDLANEVIFLAIPGQSMNSRVRQMFTKAGIPLKYASEYSTEVSRHMVANGRGISFTTQHTLHNHPDIRYLPLRQNVNWEQRLYWHRGRQLTPQQLDFRNFVTSFFRNTSVLSSYLSPAFAEDL